MGRAILWLVAGIGVFVLLLVAVVPGALKELSVVGELAGFAAIAGVPGAVVLVAVAVRRRSSTSHGSEG